MHLANCKVPTTNNYEKSFLVRWRLSQKLAGIIGTWPELYDTVQVIVKYFEATDNKIST